MNADQVFTLIAQHAGYAATVSGESDCGGAGRLAEKHHV